MEVKSTRIQNLDEKGWKDYFYLGSMVTLENIHPDEWLNFKKDRLDQYENAPEGFQMEECLLTYNGEAFGWLAFRLGSQYLSFIYNSKLEIVTDDILKGLLAKIYDYMINDGKEAAYFWSSNFSTTEKLKLSGAELIDEIEGDSQFNLTKTFLEKI